MSEQPPAPTDRQPEEPSAGLRSKRALRRALSAVISLAVIAGLVLLAQNSIDVAALGRALAAVNGAWLAAGFALMSGAFLARGESWFVVVRAALPKAKIGRAAVTRALLIGMATSAVTPGRIGEGVRAWAIARRLSNPRQHLALVAGTLVAQTLMNLLALTILTIVALVGSGVTKSRPEALLAIVTLPIAIVGFAIVAPPAVERLSRGGNGTTRAAIAWLSRQLSDARHGLFAFRRLAELTHSLTAQLGAWALQLACCWATLNAFDFHLSNEIAAAAGVLVATNITAIVPLTPSNVGVFQAACIAVLAGFGVHSSEALAFGFVLQGIEVVSALLLGGGSLLKEGSIISLHETAPPQHRPSTPV